MALDAGMIAALAHELRAALIGGKTEKIHQPERDRVDLYMRAGRKQARLTLSACPGNPRAGLSELPKENPAVPPMFCVLLRKHLNGGILEAIEQPGFERMLVFIFRARDEMGFERKRTVVCEMMGKYGNLLLLDEEKKILGVLRPVDFTSSEKRQLLVGMTYELPPKQEGKIDPTTEGTDAFIARAEAAGMRGADKFIVSTYFGVSPLIAREISFRATGRTDAESAENARALQREFDNVFARVREGLFSPCLIRVDGKNAEYSFMPIEQYGRSAEAVLYDSPSKMLDDFHAEREREERIRRRAQDLYKLLHNIEARLLRKIALQEEELRACADKERLRQCGELIKANLYALKKGDKTVTVTDWFDPDAPSVTLTLDGRLTPAEEAQRYFKKYAKAKTAERELTAQISAAKEELAYIRSVLDALDRAELPNETEEIRQELCASGYISKRRIPPSKKAAASGFLTYRSSDGYKILCGRNNLQNDALSLKIAEKSDWWFHVHASPGSHVILLCGGVDDPPARAFTEAAAVAAANSSLAGNARVTVDYTRVKNLKKPPAARPGYVIYHTNYSAEVDPKIEKTLKKE